MSLDVADLQFTITLESVLGVS